MIRRVRGSLGRYRRTGKQVIARVSAAHALRRFSSPYRLHVGCGTVRLPGWVNADGNAAVRPDLLWDARRPFPLPAQSCSLIYSEHFIEHLGYEDGVRFVTDCHRLLRPGGVLRLATPSLSRIVAKYSSDDWRDQDWLRWPEYSFIQTKAQMLNIAMRWWGHEWLYDEEELRRCVTEAGFTDAAYFDWGQSNVPELRGLETRPDSVLICELTRQASKA